MSIFDLLDLILPFTIRARILLQKIWESKIKWDEQLLDDEFQDWLSWLKEFSNVKSYKIPRCYQLTGGMVDPIELHTF